MGYMLLWAGLSTGRRWARRDEVRRGVYGQSVKRAACLLVLLVVAGCGGSSTDRSEASARPAAARAPSPTASTAPASAAPLPVGGTATVHDTIGSQETAAITVNTVVSMQGPGGNGINNPPYTVVNLTVACQAGSCAPSTGVFTIHEPDGTVAQSVDIGISDPLSSSTLLQPGEAVRVNLVFDGTGPGLLTYARHDLTATWQL